MSMLLYTIAASALTGFLVGVLRGYFERDQ